MRVYDEAVQAWRDLNGRNRALFVDVLAALANERNKDGADPYGVGVPECDYTVANESGAEFTISNDTPALLFGVYVNTAPDAALQIRDGTNNSGTLVFTIPSGAAVGTLYNFFGTRFNTGIFFDIPGAATAGNFTFMWRYQ